MNPTRLDHLLLALAAGDSLGSTSEFTPTPQIPALYAKHRPAGWPFTQIGGGHFNWPPGAPTDDTDMALCLTRSAIKLRHFDGNDVATRFIHWLDSSPPDIGATTRATLTAIKHGQPWHTGALPNFQSNPDNAANGSLMRNGVIPGIATSLHDALRISILHSLITHFAPLPVLCCCAHTWLICNCFDHHLSLESDWKPQFLAAFSDFLTHTQDPAVKAWHALTLPHHPRALQLFNDTDFHPDTFNPFTISYRHRAGYCLLTLQIAVWAAAWSRRNRPFPTPIDFPEEPFTRTGPWTLAWVAMIGHDADTYGATAAPLILAATGHVPKELTTPILIQNELTY